MLLTRLENLYGKPTVYSFIGVITLLLALGIYFSFFKNTAVVEEVVKAKKQVFLGEAGLLGNENFALRTVGTVRAVSEARLQTEASGRVTAVNVAIGDYVTAGTVLASIENSRERATLLQAEGAYESAQVANTQTKIDLKDAGTNLAEAEIAAKNTYRTAFTTGDDIIRNLVDELFWNPNSRNPGIRIDTKGKGPRLSDERMALGTMLETWDEHTKSAHVTDSLALLTEAESNITRIGLFVSQFSLLVSDMDADEVFTADRVALYKTRFGAARTRIDTTLQSLSAARTAIRNAEQTADGEVVDSASSARIKQALGSLRAAQSAYEKTLVRSPISGVVNAFYLRANEYVSMSAPAAVVANNGALEVTTSVSEEERTLIAIGNTVTLNTNEKEIKGTITRIAPALDPQTGKIEVKISIDEKGVSLENGSTVSLSLLPTKAVVNKSTDLRIPLQSLKITAEGPVVFIVTPEHTLEAKPVTLGAITGDLVLIKSGIDAKTQIVTDARGLKSGDSVEVITK